MQGNKKLWLAILLLVGFVALGGYHRLNRARYQANEPLLHDLQTAKLAVPEDQPLGKEGDWPQWRGRRRDGITHEKGLLTQWPEGGPVKLWEFNFGAESSGGIVGRGLSSVAVADGRAFTQFQDGTDEIVICLDAATGKENWRLAYPSEKTGDPLYGPAPRATPTVAGDRVYTMGGNGVFHCLDTQTGKPLWKHDLVGEFGAKLPHWGFACSPLIEGDLVIVQAGGSPGTAVMAFRRYDGGLVWQSEDDPPGYSSPMAATMAGKRQIVALTGNRVIGLEPTTGALYWQYPWPTANDVNAATPIIRGEYVLVSSGYGKGCGLLQIAVSGVAMSAQLVYENNELTNHFSTSVLVGENVYGFTDKRRLICMDFRTGKVAWDARDLGHGSLLATDESLLIFSESGELVLAEPTAEGFRTRGTFSFTRRKPCWSPPAIAQGKLYVRDGGRLACYDMKKPGN